eukprot:CAMPEP_0197650696 /NCGR_PEP_ID=MMETSP1338-20131121/31100_1 /TAXON_ID=43686 ORGANISM="Pelagodinium beii, Strain RCC1491" /NCGR_SAMPLE_ID=MMETSP1338 /ASSEMBLY_ACC=CAM_ASM_000754 /LENGTH=69 /DNA_ID=CAMNT_0043225153 /DNA_START=465 /DNA_END=674 /DNA_ORIENTATION=+
MVSLGSSGKDFVVFIELPELDAELPVPCIFAARSGRVARKNFKFHFSSFSIISSNEVLMAADAPKSGGL